MSEACRGRLVPVRDGEVADLPGRAAGASVDLSADEEPCSYADADLQVDGVVDAACGAQPALGENGQVHLVVDEHGTGERAAEPRSEPDPLPPGSCGASVTRPLAGSTIPGVPTATAFKLERESAASSSARRAAERTCPRTASTLVPVLVGRRWEPTIWPLRSAARARILFAPMSMPRT